MAHLLIDRKTYLVTQCWAPWDQLCEAENGGHGSVQVVPPLGQTEKDSWQNRAARDLRSIPVDLEDREVERKVENKKSEDNELQSFLYHRGYKQEPGTNAAVPICQRTKTHSNSWITEW